MKFFSILFSLYLLMLLVLPCSDNIEFYKSAKITISLTDKHENHSHDIEHCTPFCFCACCGVHAFQIQAPLFFAKANVLVYEYEKLKTTYSFFDTNTVSTKIWQPPRS